MLQENKEDRLSALDIKKKIVEFEAADSNRIYNIVVLGNTGVGKSSLLNCLAGDKTHKVFEVSQNDVNLANLTKSGEFNAMGNVNYPRMRLVDTKGLEFGSFQNEMDSRNIQEIIKKLNQLKHIDLFLFCLDGTNPRFTSYVKTTIESFKKISPNFLSHAVLVFNKWTSADPDELNHRQSEYQEIFSREYHAPNIPCYFIDSHFNLEKIRYNNVTGEAIKATLHPNIQRITLEQIYSLLLFLKLKNSRYDIMNSNR